MRTEQPQPIYLKDYTPPPYLIRETRLTVRLGPASTLVTAEYTVERNPKAKGKPDALVLNGQNLELVRVAVDGQPLDESGYQLLAHTLTLLHPPSKPFRLTVETRCNPEANKALSGLYLSSGIFCTQCEPEGFRRIAYTVDRPDVLSTYTVRIEAPKKLAPVLLSNGNLIESGDLPKGQHFAVWHDPHPKPSYLFALVGGDLACVTDTFTTRSGRKVDLRIYVEHGKEARCGWAMESLKASMRWDEERFGLEYDLDIFMVVAVSAFNMGAMENKGLNIFNDRLILASPETATDTDYEAIESVVAHEYFHNWTGNRVTCRDWFQLCLKEGLTVFRDQEFTADTRDPTLQRINDVRLLETAQFPEDAGPLAHPVRPQSFVEINNFYTTTVYEKGAELCRMLQTMLGRDGFRKGLDLYFQRHDGQAVTVEDFVSAMGDANGQDLSGMMLWYGQAGTPTLSARFVYSEANKSGRLSLSQSYPAPHDGEARKPVPIPVRAGFVPFAKGTDTSPEHLIVLRKRKETFAFENMPERVVPSLLRGFSAPVKLDVELKERDALTLVRSDPDLFNRWQAAQTFAMSNIVQRVRSQASVNTRFLAALGEHVTDAKLTAGYRAALLTFPYGHDIAHEMATDVDPDAVHRARYDFLAAAGKRLRSQLLDCLAAVPAPAPYTPDADSIGKRRLRAACLTLLAMAGNRGAIAEVKASAKSAPNMTETLSALGILAQLGGDAFSAALDRFYRRWKGEPLVVDKWFRLQATAPSSDAVAKVEALAHHPLFNWETPNRVRALYGAFAHGNLTGFNHASGEGYALVADAILKIDGFNPQVASQLTTAFESLRMLEPKRQALAREAVGRILSKESLSRDVKEVAQKIADAPPAGPTP
jgi:aminopeptidase N